MIMTSSNSDGHQDPGLSTIYYDMPNLIYNLHENIKVQPKHKSAIVNGQYAYYHYGIGMDDSGWGCAYRSFQTICSWLKIQGHLPDSSATIPSHQQIQQSLVDVGDKPSKFVGSKQWIGSLELSFCLQNLFGITSKILSSKNGQELSEHARALIFHFENGGAPVMIGGGQLAHTILGVDYNPRLGECQYLVLDPHFNNDPVNGRPDNVEEILAGGWCGWKPATFWSKKDFYNLLLVQIEKKPNEGEKS